MSERLAQLLDAIKPISIPSAGRTYSAPLNPALNGSWSLVTTFGGGNRSQVWGMAKHGGAMLYGVGGDHDGAAQIWRYDGSWSNVTPSWGDQMARVPSMLSHGGYVYATTSSFAGESQIWRSSDGVNWSLYVNFGSTVSHLLSLTAWNGHLYVGVDKKSGNGGVWSSSNSWASAIWTAPGDYAYCLKVHGGNLYVGTGYPAKVFKFDGSTWTQVSDFDNPDLSIVETMTSYRGDLVVAFGRTFSCANPPPCVMSFDGLTWDHVGTTQPGEWRTSHNFNASTVLNDTLMVSMGSFYGGISLWAFDGEEWVKVGSRPTNFGADITGTSFSGEWIYNLLPDGNDLYVSFASIPVSNQPAIWKYTV